MKKKPKTFTIQADSSMGPINHEDQIVFEDIRKHHVKFNASAPTGQAWMLTATHERVTMIFTEKSIRQLYLWLEKTYAK